VQQHNSESLAVTFSHKLEGHYIKAKEIVQNTEGDMFLCPYLNDGVFNLLIFDKKKVVKDLNINEFTKGLQQQGSEQVEIDDKTRPNDNFPDPFCNACFIDNTSVFINLYHSKTSCMWHFTYSIVENKIASQIVKTELLDNTRDFPLACYYDETRNYVFIFFR